ncbi:C-glycoside deglycosidase beta subunit domain-containing protein [Paenibacillus periandrae]|uniref:C-glycoside deglycosidase beta subunit domain-containing protein n=1 Tax=Paenibacillus periandrae TaxID=1761741 RepID=UPI001F09AD12|nr:DUF6379 domain-containing protein [Paenibacillus periandrae]
MNEKYMICPEGFENINEDGKRVGFNLPVRIPYYLGISLSMIDDIQVKVDGEKIPRENLRFTTRAGYPFTLTEMETVTKYRWEYGEKAKVTALMDGGLAPGKHKIEVKVFLRIAYMPKGSFAVAEVEIDVQV